MCNGEVLIVDIESEIKTIKQNMLNETLERTTKLLDLAEKIAQGSSAGKYFVHICLLDQLPLLEEVLDMHGYKNKDDIINRVRKIANNAAPTSGLEFYR